MSGITASIFIIASSAARAIADGLPGRFGHEGTGGFFLDAEDETEVPIRSKPVFDGTVPSGNSAAAMLYVRLAGRTGEAAYRDAARRTLESFSELLTLRPLLLPSMVVALSAASAPEQLDPAPAVQP